MVVCILIGLRYGEQAAEYTNASLGAAGHALGTAWAVFKIRKAFQPKSAINPTAVVSTAQAEMKAAEKKAAKAAEKKAAEKKAAK